MKNVRETWKVIPGFSSYEASSRGRVRSSRVNWIGGKRILKPADNGNGYLNVKLVNDEGKTKKGDLHDAVLLAFNGSRPEGYQAAHINSVRTDNRAVNLLWKTPVENGRDKVIAGSALPDTTILLVQAMLKAGTEVRDIAELAHVSVTTVRRVALGMRKPVVNQEPNWLFRQIGALATRG